MPANILPGIRVPLYYAGFDPSRLSAPGARPGRSLIIAQMTSSGTASANVPVRVTSAEQASGLFGAGSIAHLMAAAYLRNDPMGTLYVVPVADNGSGVAATKTITVTGPATEDGTITLRVGARRVQVAVSSGDANTAIAAAIEAALDDDVANLPFTAGVASEVVTLTAKNKGTAAQAVQISHSHLGVEGNESLPAGVGLTIADGTTGETDPVITSALSALADELFDFIAIGFSDSTARTALLDEVEDRFAPERQVYGHAWEATQGSTGTLEALAYDSRYLSVVGYETANVTPRFEMCAAYMAACASSLRGSPQLPVQTLRLRGVMTTPAASRFTITERNSLLGAGVSTTTVQGNQVVVERCVTTATTAPGGAPLADPLDVEPIFQSITLMRGLRSRLATKYARFALADDGTRIPTGSRVVTPSKLFGEMLAYYREQEGILVEDVDGFKELSSVVRSADDPNRADAVFAPDLINQLRVLAVLFQPYLQYPEEAA